MVSQLRLYFATDIHGSEICFRKFVNSARYYSADVIILGGDITGKMIVPLVRQTDGSYLTTFLGQTQHVPAWKIDEMEHLISYVGYYPFRTEPDELAALQTRHASIDDLFHSIISEKLAQWLSWAEAKLKPLGTRCLISPGNDDDWIVDQLLAQSDFVENPDGRLVDLDDHYQLLGIGASNVTPFGSPRELTEEVLEERLNKLISSTRSMERTILSVHVPPINTVLDQAPALTTELAPVVEGGRLRMIGAGSSAVRSALEASQPLVSLHGHIHESRATAKLGRTLAINPGSEYGEGVLLGALLTLSKRGLESYQLTSG